jgi:hypothetical protein
MPARITASCEILDLLAGVERDAADRPSGWLEVAALGRCAEPGGR